MPKSSQQSQDDSFKLESMRNFQVAFLTTALLLTGCGSDLSVPTKGSGSGSSGGSSTSPAIPAPVTPNPVPNPVPNPAPNPVPNPAPNPAPPLSTDAQKALQLVNTARAQSRQCGTTTYPAVPALTWNTKLESAAKAFNQEMIAKQFFDHIGPDGSTPGTRLTAQGYSWSTIGENIALGSLGSSLDTVSGAMQGWLASAGHCRNIMNANFTEMGLVGTAGAWRADNGETYDAMYWTQEFGRPQ